MEGNELSSLIDELRRLVERRDSLPAPSRDRADADAQAQLVADQLTRLLEQNDKRELSLAELTG